MARELIWTGFMTLDGAVDSPGGAVEGHPGGGWVMQTPFDEASFAIKGEELEETSALMLGRRSYEAFGDFWPKSEEHAPYNALPKYLVSSTADDDAIVDGWGETTILRSDDDVRALKETDGGAIFIHGSAELARRLGAAGLIDRYHLLVFPFLLPGAKGLFSQDGQDRTQLELRDSEAYGNGVLKLVYGVRR